MNIFKGKLEPILKVETIKTLEGNEFSFCPERGGIITSLKFKGEEILFLDKNTFEDSKVNVKGGIPILFPNAGPIPEEIKTDKLKNLKQHGFARDLKWNSEKGFNNFKEILKSNEETKKVFPYDFDLSLVAKFNSDNSFSIIQTIKNLEKDKKMPISSGLHPYFRVSSLEKKNIKFNFEGGELAEDEIKKWSAGKAIKAMSIKNPNKPLEVEIPGIGTLILNISKEYERIWIWSQENKDFICIEPIMRDKGGIILNPEKIKPGEEFKLSFDISLKKE